MCLDFIIKTENICRIFIVSRLTQTKFVHENEMWQKETEI